MIRKKKTDKGGFTNPFAKKKDVNLDDMAAMDQEQEDMVFADADDETEDIHDIDVGEYELMTEEKGLPIKKIALIAGIAVVGIAGIITLIVKNINSGDEGKVYVESVSIVAGLDAGTGVSNRYTGVVDAQDSWKISLDAEMSVEKCYVKVGDEVSKGQKLFKYNTEELNLSLEKKQLEVDTMENEITQLGKDIETYQNDLKNATATEKIELQTQILTAQTTIKKDEYAIKSGKEEIEKIEKTIKDATVKSKMDGVVKNINEALGSSSGGEDDMGFGYDDGNGEDASAYMTILAIGDYRVKAKISETNMASITEGDPVIIRSRVDDEVIWTGTIDSIKTDETASENTNSEDSYYSEDMGESASSYYFYVELDSDDDLLMGQHVFVEPDYGQEDDREGMWISSAYLLIEEDNYYVWADNNGRLEKRSVEVGEYDDIMDEYQILGGITENDYIACDDFDLKEGMKTTKVDPYADEEYEEDESYGDDFEDGEFDEEFNEEGDEEYDEEGAAFEEDEFLEGEGSEMIFEEEE